MPEKDCKTADNQRHHIFQCNEINRKCGKKRYSERRRINVSSLIDEIFSAPIVCNLEIILTYVAVKRYEILKLIIRLHISITRYML